MKDFLKIISLVLAALLLSVALAACGDNNDTETDTSDVQTTSDTTDTEAVTESDTESDAESDTEAQTFKISLGTDNGDGWDEYNDVMN